MFSFSRQPARRAGIGNAARPFIVRQLDEQNHTMLSHSFRPRLAPDCDFCSPSCSLQFRDHFHIHKRPQAWPAPLMKMHQPSAPICSVSIAPLFAPLARGANCGARAAAAPHTPAAEIDPMASRRRIVGIARLPPLRSPSSADVGALQTLGYRAGVLLTPRSADTGSQVRRATQRDCALDHYRVPPRKSCAEIDHE